MHWTVAAFVVSKCLFIFPLNDETKNPFLRKTVSSASSDAMNRSIEETQKLHNKIEIYEIDANAPKIIKNQSNVKHAHFQIKPKTKNPKSKTYLNLIKCIRIINEFETNYVLELFKLFITVEN